MLRFSLFLCACLSLSISTVHAQNPGLQRTETDNRYLLRTQNTPGVRQNYVLEETTVVTRTRVNVPQKAEPVTYRRHIVYYLTQHANDQPQDGFTKLEVNLDSMTYSMTMADQEWEYDSQVVSTGTSLGHIDIETSTALLNRPFIITLSPYGDIVRTESEEIDWLKRYVLVDGRTMLDTLQKFIWLDGVSPEVVRHLADVRLNLLPFTFVAPDSTWKRPVAFRADGVDFTDTASVTITGVEGDDYILKATADSLVPVQRSLYKFERTRLVDLTGGSGSADMTLRLSRFGMVQSASWTVQAQTRFRDGEQEFTESIQKDVSLQLTGQYRW